MLSRLSAAAARGGRASSSSSSSSPAAVAAAAAAAGCPLRPAASHRALSLGRRLLYPKCGRFAPPSSYRSFTSRASSATGSAATAAASASSSSASASAAVGSARLAFGTAAFGSSAVLVFAFAVGNGRNPALAEARSSRNGEEKKKKGGERDGGEKEQEESALEGIKSYVLSMLEPDEASKVEVEKAMDESAGGRKEEGRGGAAGEEEEWTTSSRNGGGASPEEGPKRVTVNHDPELLEELPVISLEEVRRHDGLKDADQLLVSYDGVVYDVTEFARSHPGGRDLLLTAAGMDLEHFFANYTVHAQTEKAAHWLAPLAVGKLSPEDSRKARELSNPEAHVAKRGKMLRRARRRVVFVAASLPVWMTVRSLVRFVGWFIPPLGRLLAWGLPVTVPGLTPGSEPLKRKKKKGSAKRGDEEEEGGGTVAIVGGGIAGCGAAWSLLRSGYRVTLFEAREDLGGNARTFEWDFSQYGVPKEAPGPEEGQGPGTVRSCVSVTAWPQIFYKNYTALLDMLGIETVHQPLSWFLNSKVPGKEGTLWGADLERYDGSLRNVFASDFSRYDRVVRFSRAVTDAFTLKFMPWRWRDTPSMYDTHTGLGLLNPLTIVPLYSLFKTVGGTDQWWDIIFTPYYTASFLVDELRPFPAVFGPMIEAQIPLIPHKNNTWKGSSARGDTDCNITTCVTWKDAGNGIREVFRKLTKGVDLRTGTRVRAVEVLPNGKKRVYDENDEYVDVDRVIFACPANAVGNIYRAHSKLAETILSTPVYADDHHPASGHMHAVMHSDGSVIEESVREDCLKRASNYVEVTQLSDGSLNIENQYNFGVQTPGPGVYDLPLDKKPVMLISHALGEGKSIDPSLIHGTGNHARAHPLYSGWNVMAQLSLRLVQGRDGIYYCSNWTTPGNCHDMSLLSGLVCAHAVGAEYPFQENKEAKKDFNRLRDLMGI